MQRLSVLLVLLCIASVSQQADIVNFQCHSASNETVVDRCRCQLEPVLHCTLGKPNSAKRYRCNDSVVAQMSSMEFNCDGTKHCQMINLESLLVSRRQRLFIHKCKFNISTVSFSNKYVENHAHWYWHVRLRSIDVFTQKLELNIYYRLKYTTDKFPPNEMLELRMTSCHLTQLPVELILKSPELQTVDFSNNRLSEIKNTEFSALFFLSSVETAIFDNNQLQSFGELLFRGLLLSLRYKATMFAKTQKEKGNLLGSILRFWLRAYDSAERIDFKTVGRKFEKLHITLNFGSRESSVRYLSLNHNQLRTIPVMICGFSKLTYLSIAYNKLKEVFEHKYGYDVFIFTRDTLKHLNLEGNNISKIPKGGFTYFTGLHNLSLANNRIDEYSLRRVLKYTLFLKELYVTNNNLKGLTCSKPLRQLEVLDMSRNFFTVLDTSMTDCIPTVRVMSLSNNEIKSISSGALQSLRQLQRLDLSGNRLLTLTADSLRCAQQPSLARRPVVLLKGNRGRLKCNCNSVFPHIIKEELIASTSPFFHYPEIRIDDKYCLDHNNQLTLFSMKSYNKSLFLCHYREVACKKHCACCNENSDCNCRRRCPFGCVCTHDEEWKWFRVDCTSARLNNIPMIDGAVDEFVLRKNHLKEIYSSDLNSPFNQSLTRLDLSNNKLQYLEDRCFKSLVKLRVLYLNSNKLVHLSNKVFEGLLRLRILRLDHNLLKSLDPKTFKGLPLLHQLHLESNPFSCNCESASVLSGWLRQVGRRYGVGHLLCQITPRQKQLLQLPTEQKRLLLSPMELQPFCQRVDNAVHEVKKMRIIICAVVAAFLCICILCCAALYRRRHPILLQMDLKVRSPFLRKSFGFTPCNSKPIDVVLVAHENQTVAEREILHHLQGATPRQKRLKVQRIAYYMPGAAAIDNLMMAADNTAAVIVLLSNDFLDDVAFSEAFRIFMRENVHSTSVNVLPIYMEESVMRHALFNEFRFYLREYNSLRWGCPYFWERLMRALPPTNRDCGEDTELSAPMVDQQFPCNEKLSDVCVVSHENQLHVVRHLFEHLRHLSTICHIRDGRLFGIPLEKPTTLDDVLLKSKQVVLVISLALLDGGEKWLSRLTRALASRLEHMPYRNSVLVVNSLRPEIYLELPNSAQRLADLLTNRAGVTCIDSDVLNNDVSLNEFFLHIDFSNTNIDPTAFDEPEFRRLLLENGIELETKSPDDQMNRIDVNRLRDMDRESPDGSMHALLLNNMEMNEAVCL